MNIASSTIRVFSAQLTKGIILFAGTAYFAQVGGAAFIGKFFLFQSAVIITSLLTDLGIQGSIEKRVSEGRSKGKILSSAVIVKLLPTSLILFVIISFRHRVNDYLGGQLAILLIVGVLLHETWMLCRRCLKGELKLGVFARLDLVLYTTWIVISVVLFLYTQVTNPLIFGLLLGYVFAITDGIRNQALSLKFPSRDTFESLIRFSFYDFVSRIRGYVYARLDILIIGVFLTQSAVGLYEVAWRVTTVVILLSDSVGTVIFPQISEADSDGKNKGSIIQLISKAIFYSTFFTVPCIVGVLILSEQLLAVIFSTEYASASIVLIILMFDKGIESVQIIFDRALRGLNNPRAASIAAFISMVSNILLNLVFVWKFGIEGAAVATLVSSLIGFVFYFIGLSNMIRISFPVRQLIIAVFAAVIMGSTLYILSIMLPADSPQNLALYVVSGASIYLSVTFVFPSVRRQWFTFMTNIS